MKFQDLTEEIKDGRAGYVRNVRNKLPTTPHQKRCNAIYMRTYRIKDEETHQRVKSHSSEWKLNTGYRTKEDKKKYRARFLTRQAVKHGIIVKPQYCECGNENPQAHHDNYDDHLNVHWLCQSCHALEHRKYA